jgi:hypothetical protein
MPNVEESEEVRSHIIGASSKKCTPMRCEGVHRAAAEVNVVDLDSIEMPSWLKEGLKKLDVDGDGLDKNEVDDMLQRVADEKRKQKENSDEISYAHMPEKVQEVMRKWDDDLSGTVSVAELINAAKAQDKLQQENRVVKRLLFAAVIVIILLGVMGFATSLAAVESGKDFKPKTQATTRRLQSATSGGNQKGALSDGDTLIGTVVPMDTYGEMDTFVKDRPPKEMLDNIKSYSFYDPDTGSMSNHKIESAEFIEGDLVMMDSKGQEYMLTPAGDTIETRKDGSARVVPDKKPNGLLEPIDAGKKELVIEAPPEQPEMPTGGAVPSLEDHCPEIDGEAHCNIEGAIMYVNKMYEAGAKGGFQGPKPTDVQIKAFFAKADCNADGYVSLKDKERTEAGIPCPKSRRQLRQLSMIQRPFKARRLEAQRRLRRRLEHDDDSMMVGPPAGCVPVVENAHILMDDNDATKFLPAKKRGPAMAKLLALDADKDGCVSEEEHSALKMSDLEGANPQDCSKVRPPRSCRCLPDGVDSIKMENAENMPPQCLDLFFKLDRDGNGELTRKECDEGSATKAEDQFFKVLQYGGTCPQNTGLVDMQTFIDFKVGDNGEDAVQAEIYAKVADMDEDGFLDMVEAAATPKSILNDMHGDRTAPTTRRRRLSSGSPQGTKRRLKLIRTMMESRIVARVHRREQRRLSRELSIRERMLEKVGSTKFGRWLEARVETGKEQRRLQEDVEKSSLRKEDFAGMTTDELKSFVGSLNIMPPMRRLEERFGAVSDRTRRLLGLEKLSTEARRRLDTADYTLTTEQAALETDIKGMFGSFAEDDIITFLDNNEKHMWEPEVKEKYEACPSPFYMSRGEDLQVDDVNTVHDYPAGSDILTGTSAVEAVVAATGMTNEQAEHKIMNLYGTPTAEGDKGRRQRLRRLAERDPLHRRRMMTGEFATVDPANEQTPTASLDQCEFLHIVDPQQYDKLMSHPEAQIAYYDGERDPCYAPLDTEYRADLGMPEPEPLTTGETMNCIMPSNTFVDPSTHEIHAEEPAGTITPFEYAAAQTMHAPACKDLPWEEKIMETVKDKKTKRMKRKKNGKYRKNWNHDKPGKGCARSCCVGGDEGDCEEGKLIRDCPCLKAKKKCMKHMTNKLISSSKKGKGKANRRMRRHKRRLARKQVVNERRRRRRLERLLPFERRRLMVQDYHKRQERRRLDGHYYDDMMMNPDGSHNFCAMHEGFPEYCGWDWGCTTLYSTTAKECSPCSAAASANDCNGECVWQNSLCQLPNECTGLDWESCQYTTGCSHNNSTCARCSDRDARSCTGEGCFLNGEHLCVANDMMEWGPSGSTFDEYCPLRTTATEAACALDPSLPCSPGSPPSDAQMFASYDAMTHEDQKYMQEMTNLGMTYEMRELVVEHLTTEEHPIDFDDIENFDNEYETRRLTEGDAAMDGGMFVTDMDSSMYAVEDPFMYASSNSMTLSSTDAAEFLTQCNAPPMDSPAAGEMQGHFCEDVAKVDEAMHAMGNNEYEIDFDEADYMAEDSFADHLIDVSGSGFIDHETYVCACTQTNHMNGDECSMHYHDTAENGVSGMTWEEFEVPPPAMYAMSAAEEMPYTPDSHHDHAMDYMMYETHDEAIEHTETASEGMFWYMYGAAHTNNITRRRRLMSNGDLTGEFDDMYYGTSAPVCDPVEAKDLTLSGLEYFQWEIEDLRYSMTELENFYASNSSYRRLLQGHQGTTRRLQADSMDESLMNTRNLLAHVDTALDAIYDKFWDPAPMDYMHMYPTPPEVLELVCVHLRPENMPYKRKNVITYEPMMFNDTMMQTEPEYFASYPTTDTMYTTPMPMPGDSIPLADLNPMPEPPFTMASGSRCDMDPMECYWQDEPPYMFTEMNVGTGAEDAYAMRWDSTPTWDETARIDPAASRVMATGAWPWESTMDEFTHAMGTVTTMSEDPATKQKQEMRQRKANSDAADPMSAANMTMPHAEPPIMHAQLEGLFHTMSMPGLDVIPHPIPAHDHRNPQEACKEFAGVDSGLQIGSVGADGTFTHKENVDFFGKCVKHRVEQKMFEEVNDIRHAVANQRATATMAARLRRRLSEKYGDHVVRRLFAGEGDSSNGIKVNPLTLTRKHSVHRKRALRQHARRLKVQQKRRLRRRRLSEGADEETMMLLAPNVIDRVLMGTDTLGDAALLNNAEKAHFMAQFDKEARTELATIGKHDVMEYLPMDDFEHMVESMHEYYGSFIETPAAATDPHFECMQYNPNFNNTVQVPVVDDIVTLTGSYKSTFEHCTEPFHYGMPEEAMYFADMVKEGEMNMGDYFGETFPGHLPTPADVTLHQEIEAQIFSNPTEFPSSCYCECRDKELYNKPLSAACNGSPTFGGVLDTHTICEHIHEAPSTRKKQKECPAPASLAVRRLSSELETTCVKINDDVYCKPGTQQQQRRKLSTRAAPSRHLQRRALGVAKHLKTRKARALGARRLQPSHRRKLSRAISRATRAARK